MNLKNISVENLHDAPKMVWAVVFVFIMSVVSVVSGFLVLKVTGIQEEYESTIAKEVELKKTLSKRLKFSRSLELIEAEIKKMETRLESAKKQLPSELNMDEFIESLAATTKLVGIVVNVLEADKEVKSSFLVTQPFKIEGCSGYHQIGQFLSELSQIQRIITFDKFKMENALFVGSFSAVSGKSSSGRSSSGKSAKDDPCSKLNLLPFSAVVSTYKYIEVEGAKK